MRDLQGFLLEIIKKRETDTYVKKAKGNAIYNLCCGGYERAIVKLMYRGMKISDN